MNDSELSMPAEHSDVFCMPAEQIRALQARYGVLMTADEVVRELKFSSHAALRMARKRGFLQLDAVKLPGRREHVYKTSEVIDVLSSWLSSPQEVPM